MTDQEHLLDIPLRKLEGEMTNLREYEGQVLLIVNTASRCGFTPQYAGLEELYRKYQSRGFVVLGFPCNQFGAQESGTDEEIRQFCNLSYDVTFPIYSKIDVNGSNAHPLYVQLKKRAGGIFGTSAVKWNFTKFLVDRNAGTVKRFAPSVAPADLEKHILRRLQ